MSPVTFLNPWLHLGIHEHSKYFDAQYTHKVLQNDVRILGMDPGNSMALVPQVCPQPGLEAGMDCSESMSDVNVKASEQLSEDDEPFGSREPQYYSLVCTQWLHVCFEQSTKIIFTNSLSQSVCIITHGLLRMCPHHFISMVKSDWSLPFSLSTGINVSYLRISCSLPLPCIYRPCNQSILL